MSTFFKDLFLITYRVDSDRLNSELPEHIRAWEHKGFSYISIVVANMRGMRVRWLPAFLGSNYYQIVYRAIVEVTEYGSSPKRGVFFLRSDANDPLMSFFGNRLTAFRFHYFQTGGITFLQKGSRSLLATETADRKGDFVFLIENMGDATKLEPAFPFSSVAEEKELLVELFHAYSENVETGSLYDLEIERGAWNIQRLDVVDAFSAFFREQPFQEATAELVSALSIKNCSYVWRPMTMASTDSYIPVNRRQ